MVSPVLVSCSLLPRIAQLLKVPIQVLLRGDGASSALVDSGYLNQSGVHSSVEFSGVDNEAALQNRSAQPGSAATLARSAVNGLDEAGAVLEVPGFPNKCSVHGAVLVQNVMFSAWCNDTTTLPPLLQLSRSQPCSEEEFKAVHTLLTSNKREPSPLQPANTKLPKLITPDEPRTSEDDPSPGGLVAVNCCWHRQARRLRLVGGVPVGAPYAGDDHHCQSQIYDPLSQRCAMPGCRHHMCPLHCYGANGDLCIHCAPVPYPPRYPPRVQIRRLAVGTADPDGCSNVAPGSSHHKPGPCSLADVSITVDDERQLVPCAESRNAVDLSDKAECSPLGAGACLSSLHEAADRGPTTDVASSNYLAVKSACVRANLTSDPGTVCNGAIRPVGARSDLTTDNVQAPTAARNSPPTVDDSSAVSPAPTTATLKTLSLAELYSRKQRRPGSGHIAGSKCRSSETSSSPPALITSLHATFQSEALLSNSFARFCDQLLLPLPGRHVCGGLRSRRRSSRRLLRVHAECLANYAYAACLWLMHGGRLDGCAVIHGKQRKVLTSHQCSLLLQRCRAVCRHSLSECSGRIVDLATNLEHLHESPLVTLGDPLIVGSRYDIPNKTTTAEAIEASRLALPSRAAIKPVDELLTSEVCQQFGCPPCKDFNPDDIPRAYFNASATEWRAALRKMARIGMLKLASPEGVNPIEQAGAFGLSKPNGTQRLLCDRRPRNAMEMLLGAVDLPSARRFTRILCPQSHVVAISCRDLKDMYYVFGVPKDRLPFQTWGPRVPAVWFEDLDNTDLDFKQRFEPWLETDLLNLEPDPEVELSGFVQPCATVILMGDLNAVLIAEQAHLNLLERHGVTDLAPQLGASNLFPRGDVSLSHFPGEPCSRKEEVAFGIYIDDLGVFGVIPWKSITNTSRLDQAVIRAADRAYEAEGLPRSEHKDVDGAFEAQVWGAHVSGKAGLVQGPPAKRAQLTMITLAAIQHGINGRLMHSLLGQWSSQLQLRPAAYSVFDDVYSTVLNMPFLKSTQLPSQSRAELLCMAAISPLLVSNIRAGLLSTLYATDASHKAAGATYTPLDARTMLRLYDLAEGRGFYVRMDGSTVPTVRDILKGDIASALTVPQAWKFFFAFDFKYAAHINVLELLTLLTLVARLARDGLTSKRLIVLVDSYVVKGCATKGRSSSHSLNFLLRKLTGLCLAHDIYLELVWIPSWANSSDAPSRHYPVSRWHLEASEKYQALLSKLAVEHGFHVDSTFSTCPEPRPGAGISDMQPSNSLDLEGKSSNISAEQQSVDQAFHPSSQNAHQLAEQISLCGPCLAPSRRHRFYVAELFAGKGLLSSALARKGCRVLSCEFRRPDGSLDPSCDLSDINVVDHIIFLITRRVLRYVHLGTPCSTFSPLKTLFGGGSRSKARPQGSGRLPAEVLGNLLLSHSLLIIEACRRHGVRWSLENPQRSLLWAMPKVKSLLSRAEVRVVEFDQCMYGLKDPLGDFYKKPTRLVGNLTHLESLACSCDKSHRHQEVLGSVKHKGTWVTRSSLAGAYPSQLAESLARVVTNDLIFSQQARRYRLAPALGMRHEQ